MNPVARTHELIGGNATEARTAATNVMSIENALARASMPRTTMRDPNATYHRITVAAFALMTPHVDWRRYLERVGGRAARTVNVRTPAFYASLDSLLTSVPLDDWNECLRWR